MKRELLFSALAGMILGSLFAQAPQGIGHQAVIRDAEGKLIANKTIGIQVSILQGTAEGTVVYSETHTLISNAHGLITYVIGHGTNVSGSFENIDWAAGPYFLKTEVDPTGGTSYSIEGTVQLQSVPYALHARTSEDAFKGDMKGAPITNLADPTGAQDAASRAYVDLLEARIKQMEEVLYTFTDDRDGNTYKWVKIGNQVWMAENLNFASANSWCYEDNPTYCGHYGRLYTWAAVMNGASSSSANPSGVQGVCPQGWHVPSHDEWTQLEQYVCNQLGNLDCANIFPFDQLTKGFQGTNEGNALKSCRQEAHPYGDECNTSDHPKWWDWQLSFGTDDFGFAALPGGYRFDLGDFENLGSDGYWWSATEDSSLSFSAWGRNLFYGFSGIQRRGYSPASGRSVRCVKDVD